MDLPSTCPYCDSDQVNYTYLPGDDTADNGTLVFTCTQCGSHVESPITYFEPPAGDSSSVRHAIPTERHPDANAANHQPPTPPQRSLAG